MKQFIKLGALIVGLFIGSIAGLFIIDPKPTIELMIYLHHSHLLIIGGAMIYLGSKGGKK